MFNLPYNAEPMSQNIPGQNMPAQGTQNNFQMFHQPQMGSSQMQPSPSNICNPQEPEKHPSYQFYQGEAFRPNRQNPMNAPPPTSLCQPMFQSPYNTYNTSTPMPIQQKPMESLPQSIVQQIRACVSNAAPPIFILPGGCNQSTNHQQPERMLGVNQPGISHAPGQQLGFNYPPPPPVYCPPSFYPYPIPMPVYEPSSAARNKIPNCDCQKNAGSILNTKGRGQCFCDAECSEHHCTQTTDDTICSKMNCPSSINLQALASQLLSVPGIISCTATRLILRKIPGSNITTTLESTMDTAQRSIAALAKDQLVTESRIAQQVTALINLHMNNNPPANIVPILTLIQLKVNLLKAQVDSLINKKVMEKDGYAAEVDSANPIDPTILTLRSDSELRQMLSALRQKECDERVNVNFAPYHSQRAIAEARLNRVQNKIRQIEGEFEKRRFAALPTHPPTSNTVPIRLSSTLSNTGTKYSVLNPTVNNGFHESPDPFVVRLRSPKRLSLKPHVGCPQTTYNNSAPVRPPEKQVALNESKATETQKQETEDKSNATSDDKQNQTNKEGSKYEDSEECIFCNRQISEGDVDRDKKKLQTTTQKAAKAIAVVSSDKVHKIEGVVSSNKIAIEKDDTRLKLETNKIDPGYDQVTDDTGLSKVHWLSETSDLNLTKENKVGIESIESLHNPIKRGATAITEKIKSLTLMQNEILGHVEYKDSKEHKINDTEQLTFVAVKQEQTEPEHIGKQSRSMTSVNTKNSRVEIQIAS